MGKILGSLELNKNNNEYKYGLTGKPENIPVLYLNYRTSNGRLVPAGSFPLKIIFTEGSGNILSSPVTGPYGQLELLVDRIDPGKKNTVITAELDIASLADFGEMSLPQSHRLIIPFKRADAIALSLTFFNSGKNVFPDDVKSRLSSIAMSSEISITDTKILQKEPSKQEVTSAANTNSDFLLHVFLQSGPAANPGGYKNIFSTDVSGSMDLYSLPDGRIIDSKVIKPETGFGASGDTAGWDALERLHPQIESAFRSILERIPK